MSDAQKQMERLIERCRDKGARVEELRSGHFQITVRGKGQVVVGKSSSDFRSVENAYAAVRRELGLDIRLKRKDRRKGSVEPGKIEALRQRIHRAHVRGFTYTELGEIVWKNQRKKNIPGFSSAASAEMALHRIARGKGSVVIKNHDSIASALNLVESSSWAEIGKMITKTEAGAEEQDAGWTIQQALNRLDMLKKKVEDAIICAHRIDAGAEGLGNAQVALLEEKFDEIVFQVGVLQRIGG